jgi:nitrate reductase gamma subunit
MNGFSYFVGGVLPYLAAVVFVVGLAYRFYVWFKTPQPGKMTLFPTKEGSLSKGVLAEVLFFPSLFRGARALWFMSWIFHVTLALVFLGHIRVVTGLIDSMLFSLGVSQEGVTWLSSTVGGAAGIVMLATGLLLLARRLTTARVREVSSFSDFFALLLLLSIIVTGDLMRFGAHFDLAQTRVWALSLLTFSPVIPESGMFLVHAMLGQLLLMYIPFSKILHFGGVFFTQALVQRR